MSPSSFCNPHEASFAHDGMRSILWRLQHQERAIAAFFKLRKCIGDLCKYLGIVFIKRVGSKINTIICVICKWPEEYLACLVYSITPGAPGQSAAEDSPWLVSLGRGSHDRAAGGTVISIVETCRRLSLPVRDYLASVLPGLADFSINRVAELTPTASALCN
jgi:hypothetical protein